jgi:hypothetical protein
MSYDNGNISSVELCSGLTTSLQQPNQMALNFLQSLCDDDFTEELLSGDRLSIVSLTSGVSIGEFMLSVRAVSHQEYGECLMVHASTDGTVDSLPCGTLITAYIRRQCLETLEQRQHEFVVIDETVVGRETFILRCGNTYAVSRVETDANEDVKRHSYTVDTTAMEGFVSEAANLLLLKLLAVKGFGTNAGIGGATKLCTLAMNLDARLCSATYELLDQTVTNINGTDTQVSVLSRTIKAGHDKPIVWNTKVTRDHGQFISRQQIGSPVKMTLKTTLRPTLDSSSRTSNSDSGAVSQHDETTAAGHHRNVQNHCSVTEMKSYLRDHPELNLIMSDFLQFLLLHKPTDVVAFAARHFAGLKTASNLHSLSQTAASDLRH